MKNDHPGRKIAVGALLAGAAGYVAGILTAPKSGKETRKDIADKAEDVKEETVEHMQKLRLDLDDLIDKAKDKTVALSASAREEFNEAVVRAKDAKNKTVVMIKAAKAGEASDPELNKAIKQAKTAIKNLGKYYKA